MPGRSNKRKPPRGLVVNHDDLAALAGQPNQANNSLQAIDTEIVSLKRQVRYDQSLNQKKQKKKEEDKYEIWSNPNRVDTFL